MPVRAGFEPASSAALGDHLQRVGGALPLSYRDGVMRPAACRLRHPKNLALP